MRSSIAVRPAAAWIANLTISATAPASQAQLLRTILPPAGPSFHLASSVECRMTPGVAAAPILPVAGASLRLRAHAHSSRESRPEPLLASAED